MWHKRSRKAQEWRAACRKEELVNQERGADGHPWSRRCWLGTGSHPDEEPACSPGPASTRLRLCFSFPQSCFTLLFPGSSHSGPEVPSHPLWAADRLGGSTTPSWVQSLLTSARHPLLQAATRGHFPWSHSQMRVLQVTKRKGETQTGPILAWFTMNAW